MGRKARGRGRGRGSATSSVRSSTRNPAVKRGIKTEEDEPPPKLKKEESFNSKLQRIIEAETKKSEAVKVFKPDDVLISAFPKKKIAIHEDYSCMLNQTNIGHNNNKFYVIQIAENGKQLVVFTKWGRVGESGQNSMDSYVKSDDAIAAFKKKFKDKTKNDWDKRDEFTPHPKKYTMIEIAPESESEGEEDVVDSKIVKGGEVKIPKKNLLKTKCNLDERTQIMIKLIFSDDMFTGQMASMNLDVRKMPLGKLSKTQILKGLQALIDIEKEINGKANHTTLMNLSSQFYTLIPHDFGRQVPPVISVQSIIDQKKEMMMTLTDIEIAQSLKKDEEDENLHYLDAHLQKLGCKLERIDNNSEDFKLLKKYATVNKGTRKGELLDVWTVDRDHEGARFSQHDDISYRKLLWHGTNVAVVAAILNSGLRIMPHSGGLVGRGIYFASEHAKSSWYVGPHGGVFEGESNVGFMFLVEVALGKMHFIKQPNGSLRAAPKGFDSIVARGSSEPNPKLDVKKKFDGKDVIVPVGPPVAQKDFKDSGFGQSEYLVYKESQARIRYLLKFSFV